MITEKLWKRKLALLSLIGLLIFSGAASAHRHRDSKGKLLSDDREKLVGDWTGESICTGIRPACHDEKVVYHITLAENNSDQVMLAADKIINGQPEEMYVLAFNYDAEKNTLVHEFTTGNLQGFWEFTVSGNTMAGTLILLPDKKIIRQVKVTKVLKDK